MPSAYPNIGSLNQPITIEVNNPTPSAGSGQLVDNWTTYKKTLAAIGDNSGTEKESSESEISTLMTVFTIRYFAGITTKMRINYDGDLYNIKYMARIGRNRYLKLKGERVI